MKATKLVRPFLALAMLVMASLACELGGGPPAIGEVVVAESLDADYKPVNPTSSYTSDDKVISISVQVENLEVGSVVEVRYKLNGKDHETTTVTADQSGSGYYGFTLTAESGHASGDYVADVYLDGALAKSVSFKVVASGPPSVGEVVTATDFDASYKPVGPTSVYAPGDTFHISVQVKNLEVGNAITVKYYYEGEHADGADTTVTADEAGSGYYGFRLQPPPDGFPVGNFSAEVYLNDALSQTVYFSVQ